MKRGRSWRQDTPAMVLKGDRVGARTAQVNPLGYTGWNAERDVISLVPLFFLSKADDAGLVTEQAADRRRRHRPRLGEFFHAEVFLRKHPQLICGLGRRYRVRSAPIIAGDSFVSKEIGVG